MSREVPRDLGQARDVWGGLGTSAEVSGIPLEIVGNLGRSGGVWERSGEVWGGLGRSREVPGYLGRT
eukprot:10318751-Alexandrium_andersonii.AAC.1